MHNYGSLNLTVSSPVQTFTEPLSVSVVAPYLGLTESVLLPEDETELNMLIAAAREQAEILQNRDLIRKQWDLSLDYWPECQEIELRDPLVSVDRLQYINNANVAHLLVENTDYIVDTAKHPGVVMAPYNQTLPSFTPWPSSAILVRFTSGYSATDLFWSGSGQRIKNGMLLLISAWYNNKLPFEIGASAIQEYPYAVTSCLEYGALRRAY